MTETAVLTLADFLLARIEEDQVKRATMREWHAQGCDSLPQFDSDYTYPCACGVPERMGRECAAKRRILALHKSGEAWCDYCSGWYGPDPAAECPTLRLLALPYAEHPDFRDEWRLNDE